VSQKRGTLDAVKVLIFAFNCGIFFGVNICSLSKVALVATAVVVASGAAEPTKAFGVQTGTFPVIIKDANSLTKGKVKDTGSFPVIINPNPSQVNGDGGGNNFKGGKGFDGGSYTITVTLNANTTMPQAVILVSSNPNLISVPLLTMVPAGQISSSTTFSVPYSTGRHHHNVRIFAIANGQLAECTIKVHYQGEQD